MKALKCKCLFIIIITSVLLSACLKDADKVKLLTEKQAVGMASRKYGDAEFAKDADKTEKSITYYFKDMEYGFEYILKSFVDEVSIDGTKFGYEADYFSDFDEQYKRYLLKKVAKDNNDFCLQDNDVEEENDFIPISKTKFEDVVLKYEVNGIAVYFSLYSDYRSFDISDTFVYCYSTDKDLAIKGSKKLIKKINKLDTREYFLSEKITVHLITSKSDTPNEYDIEQIESVFLD